MSCIGSTVSNRMDKWAGHRRYRPPALLLLHFFLLLPEQDRSLASFGGRRHSSDGRGGSTALQTAALVFLSSSSAREFPVGLLWSNGTAKRGSHRASVRWLTLWVLKPRASRIDCTFSLCWGICNAWLSYCSACIKLLFLSLGEHIHFPLLLRVILVFQLTFDSKNLGSLSCPTFQLTVWSSWQQKQKTFLNFPAPLPSMPSCAELPYTALQVLYKVLKSITLLGSVLKAVGHTVSLACSSSQWKQGWASSCTS